jgi:hypothetical protein
LVLENKLKNSQNLSQRDILNYENEKMSLFKEQDISFRNNRPQEVNCVIEFSPYGLVINVIIVKITDTGNDIVYQKNLDEKKKNTNEVLTSTDAPQSQKTGQIYFNTTNSHFYGWNGKEWLQLDNAKATP